MRSIIIAASLCLSVSPALSGQITFGNSLQKAGWETVQFSLLSRAQVKPAGGSVSITTDGNGVLIWKPLPEGLRQADKASWSWSAKEAVPATDLTKKGADDRVVSVYFLFGSEQDVGKPATRLLRSDTTRALVYTFGGDYRRDSVVPSPHMGKRGKFIVKRGVSAANGKVMRESVALAEDYRRVFGSAPPLLLGVAVSSDSDDTGARNSVTLSGLSVSQ